MARRTSSSIWRRASSSCRRLASASRARSSASSRGVRARPLPPRNFTPDGGALGGSGSGSAVATTASVASDSFSVGIGSDSGTDSGVTGWSGAGNAAGSGSGAGSGDAASVLDGGGTVGFFIRVGALRPFRAALAGCDGGAASSSPSARVACFGSGAGDGVTEPPVLPGVRAAAACSFIWRALSRASAISLALRCISLRSCMSLMRFWNPDNIPGFFLGSRIRSVLSSE